MCLCFEVRGPEGLLPEAGGGEPPLPSQVDGDEAVVYEESSKRRRATELKPGGADEPVTAANVEEYLRLYAQHKLLGAVEPQVAAFRAGLAVFLALLAILWLPGGRGGRGRLVGARAGSGGSVTVGSRAEGVGYCCELHVGEGAQGAFGQPGRGLQRRY